MKNILILGGTYFIGKAVVSKFLEKSYTITLLNRGSKKEDLPGVKTLIADRDSQDGMKDALNGKSFDYIVDISGLNKNHTENLLKSIDTTALKQIVFISSSSVYDIENLQAPLKEEYPLSKNIHWGKYGEDKIIAEKAYLDWSKTSAVPVSILRPPYVYGENNYARRESFIFNHIENNRTVIIPDSDNKIQFISANDLAQIVVALIEKDDIKTDVYNVGNKEAISFSDWVKLCAKATGKTVKTVYYPAKGKYQPREYFPFHDYDNVLDVTKINKIHKEESDMLSKLRLCYKWYIENKNAIEFSEQVTKTEDDILSKK